ncbi:disks large-associated protein 5 isoform X2 [Neoarius graeffei]|uniref:disks large-associated protein 5 isoform X2 n=1 Tax=Neoarius graeffei TaxID=443677 RepID=UPI00298BCCA2|nr:disks large-associated protein 5 isoform X2 [Neoarius graeffei]
MESRFAHLYKRDSSVSMIRVKMSRRRSQTQKENREKMQNCRRHLDQLPELELSLDVSALEKSVLPSQETGHKARADKNNSAAVERKNMLARYKEKKALQKEKEKREKEKKGTFKVGLYHPQPLGYLPLNPVVPSTKKTMDILPSTRVTRSMKQHLQPKPAEKQPAPKKTEPLGTRASKSSIPVTVRGRTAPVEQVVRAPTTRSAAKAVTAAAANKSVAQPAADLRPLKTRAANRQPAAPSSGRGKTMQGRTESVAAEKKLTNVADEVVTEVNPSSSQEEKMAEEANVTPVSFAPQGFVFQPPSGLAFQPTPLSPRSADAFLSPSFSVEPCMEDPISVLSDSSSAPPLSSPPPCVSEPCPAPASKSGPPHLPCVSSSSPPAAAPLPLPSLPPATPSSAPLEPQHDVSYFRAVMANETQRLTGLSEFWELRFDDSSIPEEMRDRMRTAVGQARLLMKERFGQFSGLVDDCDFGRGEKLTTCTDLQGFWDMVYFQVEDVDRKFNALKDAEARGWQEDIKPVARQKRVVKKPPPAGGKTKASVGASAAAKSRLAAVKAAMKAKQAAGAKIADASDRAQGDSAPTSDAQANMLTAQTIVFHGGFFQVESPVKVAGVVRRSSRLSAAPFTKCSPHVSKFSTPGRQQRSTAVVHPSPLPCILTPSKSAPLTASPPTSPAAVAGTTASPVCPLKQHADPLPCSPKALHISPEQHRSAPCVSPNGVLHTQLSQPDHNTSLKNIQSDLMITPVDDQANQLAEIKPHNSPCQSEEELPRHLPVHSGSSTEPEASAQESAMTALSQEQTEVDMFHSDSQAYAMSFTHSPSACKITPRAETVENCVSVLSSPCMISTTPQQVQVCFPAPSDKTDTCVNERSISVDCKVTENQDRENMASLDFERYLQPTARCSLSPVQSMAVDRFSLGVDDAEMESPQAQAGEPVQDAPMTPTAFSRMAPLAVTPWTEEMIADQLLFTPEQRESVRESVCERDLMMFTPPADT